LRRLLLSIVWVLISLVAWPTEARADPQQQLDLATSRFNNGRYQEAADILGALLDIKADPDSAEGKKRLEIYLAARPIHAACLIALDRAAESDAVILEQYRADPFYELPPGQFPLPVSDRFIEVAARNRDKIEAWRRDVIKGKQDEAAQKAALDRARTERLAALEKLAAEERFVTTRSRWLALVPFGLGQFQNDDTGLGVFFAASETVAVATSVVSFLIAEDVKDTRCPATDPETGLPIDCDALRDRFDAARVVNWVSFGSAVALVITGVIEAQITFVDERVEIRKRPIPPPVEIKPKAAMSPEGDFYLGIEGRF
jgi:hypothetical protein